MSDLTELYQEMILDHCRHPRNFGKPVSFNYSADGFNPLCGDRVTLYLTCKFHKNYLSIYSNHYFPARTFLFYMTKEKHLML